MRFLKTSLATALVLLLVQSVASAQLLKKLEQRLGNVVEKLAQPPQDAVAGEPTPAIAPGYLGLTADETAGQQGVVVLATKAASPAEAAGLKKDDLITAINGKAVKDLNDFQTLLDLVAAGQRAQFTVNRGREALTLNATLVARQTPPVNRFGAEDPGPPPGGADPFPPAPAPTPRAATPEVDNSRASLGVSVVPLTEQARAAYGVTATRGALIAAVRAGGPAERAGIPVGGVIVAIDGQRINAADEVVEVVAAARPGQEVELSYYRGATLTRKTVRLAPAALDARGTPAATGPAAGLGGILSGGVGDRPLVRRVGEVIDGFARPAGGPPAGQQEDIATLRSQVELLQATIRSLEDRLLRLEGKLGVARPVEEVPGEAPLPRLPADDPVRRLELKLAPPEKPALPTPPPTP